MKVTLPVSPKLCSGLLVGVGVALTLINLAFSIYSQSHDADPLWPISRQFDFSEEGNFGNWYQSVTLLLCALLLVANAHAEGTQGRFRKHWLGLACIFLFVSIDEAAQVHETTVSPLLAQFRKGSKTEPPKAAPPGKSDKPATDSWEESRYRTYWLAAYGFVFLVLVLAYLRFFLQLPRNIQVGFVLAAVLYLGGAVGIEILYRKLTLHHGDHDLVCEVTSGIGELMEMLGVAGFVHALMSNLGRRDSTLEIRFTGGAAGGRQGPANSNGGTPA